MTTEEKREALNAKLGKGVVDAYTLAPSIDTLYDAIFGEEKGVPNYEGMMENYEFVLKESNKMIEMYSERVLWLYEHAPFWVKRKFLKTYTGAIQAVPKENSITVKVPVTIKFV